MANKVISEMGLPSSISNIFSARNIITAKDALSLTEFELMELLDVGFEQVKSAISHISQMVSPSYQTVSSLLELRIKDQLSGHLPTRLRGLDQALFGGIPFGVLTELVGPAGIGKTQFCLKLSLLASLPKSYGGLEGQVIYIDVESKFSSKRLIEIGSKSFPDIFLMRKLAKEMAGRILVLRPSSLSEFTESLQQIKVLLVQRRVKLLVIDSMAALVSGSLNAMLSFEPHQFPVLRLKGVLKNVDARGYSLNVFREYEQTSRKTSLAWHISFLKSVAEFSRVPVLVTNQVRTQSSNEAREYTFEAASKKRDSECTSSYDSHLVAALGIHWAHAVTVRLIFEAIAGQRFIKVAKSPMSSPLAFPFHITSSGISLLDDSGIQLMGPDIISIHNKGHDGIFVSKGDQLN